ncbi:MAG: lamin tail domain-containing protein [Myxococcota bacterium]
MLRKPRLTASWAVALGLALVIPSAGCEQDTSPLPTVEPCHVAEGGLVITEILPSPSGADDGREWIEIYNASGAAIDLRKVHLVLVRDTTDKRHTVGAAEPLLVEPGQYAVLASGEEGPEAFYVYGDSLGNMPTAGQRLRLACLDGTIIDEACYGDACEPAVEAPTDDLSFAYVGEGAPDAQANDDPAAWSVGPPTPGAGIGGCEVPPGGLVLTEILPNPEGSDDGKEWFEVYNATGAAVDLRGLHVVLSPDDDAAFHVIESEEPIMVDADAWAVLASGQAGVGEVYEYGSAIGDLRNAGDVLALACPDGTEIDRACWGEACSALTPVPGDDRTFALTASGTPDAATNDDPTWWTVQDATPGAANPEAPKRTEAEPPEGCEEPVAPQANSLVITEVMSNPEGSDSGREWLEIHVPGSTCVDVEGVVISTDPQTPEGGETLSSETGLTTFGGGGYHVVAGESADLGDVSVMQRLRGLTLRNSDGVVALWYDGQLLATSEYGDGEDGRAAQWDGVGWCTSPKPSPDGAFYGSPGEENPPCDACFCKEAGGEIIQATSPAPGELVITEVMPNVPGTEAEGALLEWFEATMPPGVSGVRSLACLTYANGVDASRTPIVNPEQSCLEVGPGDPILFGRSADPEENGGLDPDVIYEGSAMTASGGIVLGRTDGAVIDAVTSYGDSGDGVARQIGPDTVAAGDPANDDPEAWCDALPVYNEELGAQGTPGAPNLGCDGCWCRDEGGQWIEGSAPQPGELKITEVFPNTPGTEDPMWEWFEVWSAASEARHLNCLQPRFGGDDLAALVTQNPDCAPIAPGEFAVACNDPSAAAADLGIEGCLGYEQRALTGSGSIALLVDGEEIDAVAWDDASDGVSVQDGTAFDGGACDFTPPEGWCDTPAGYEFASLPDPDAPEETLTFIGTPGASNPCCPAP